ncbi:MAG: kynureninase, partial [Roseibium sp.]
MSHSSAAQTLKGGASLYRRDQFLLEDEIVYLDGNSLGPLPRSVPDRLASAVKDEWGRSLVKGWNEAEWFDLPGKVARRIEPLIGAEPETVAVGDSTSVNLF